MHPNLYRVSHPRNRRVALAMKHGLGYLSMVSLITWRATCADNYAAVNRHLRDSLHTLLRRFVPDPADFMQLLTPWGALVVGEAVLSHVLQDPSFCKSALEIAVGNLYFQAFLDNLSTYIISGSPVLSFIVKPAPSGFPYHRHVTRIAEFRLSSDLIIAVYESSTPSASDVVCGYWTTALMNFVTGYSFGCAYPRLTFNRFTLHCDSRSSFLAWWDIDVAKHLALGGFESRLRCYDWPLYARGSSGPPPPAFGDCGRSLYVCPFQGRYFGDPGSLVAFYDGFRVDLQELKDLCVPPYGPMVTWRLPSRGTCTGSYVSIDQCMPPFTVSVLTQFMDDWRGSSGCRPSVLVDSDLQGHRSDPSWLSTRLERRRSI